METYRKRCIKDEVLRNLISIITYAYKATIKRVCSRPTSPRTQAIVAGGECLNRNSKPIMKCLVTMGDTFAGIKEAQDRLKMPHICCQYAQLFDCWLEVMKRDKCEKHLEVLKDQARSVMGNFVDASCGEYHHETDKCTQLGPPPKAKNRTGNYMDELVAIFHTINP